MRLSLLAVLGVLAIAPASAGAATTINVTEPSDAPLAAGNECAGGETCTLRAAVEKADAEGGEVTIALPAGTYALSEGALWAEDDVQLTVRGEGAATTTIEGSDDSVFGVEDGSSLLLAGVTVTGGGEQYGGGVYVEDNGTLRVQDSTVTKNQAEFGGGIYGEIGSSVSVEESSITANEAAEGGGIAMETEFCRGEIATRPALRHGHAAARPQVLASGLARGLEISRSTISGNDAFEGYGGGIYNGPICKQFLDLAGRAAAIKPASISEQESGLTIDQTTISGNHAEGGESFAGIGGGVYDETRVLPDPIVDSTITGNTAEVTGGGLADGAGEAILVSDTVAANEATGEIRETARHTYVRPASNAKPEIVAGLVSADNLAADPFDEEARIELRNVIVADASGEGQNCEGVVESLSEGAGYNLDYPSTGAEEEGAVSDSCGMSAADKDLVGVDPKLDPAGLRGNGGPTATIALLSRSPAIGVVPLAGDCNDQEDGPALPDGKGGVSAVDQRGEPRPGIAGKGCDVGAYEYQEAAKEPVKETARESTRETPAPAPVPAGAVAGVKVVSPVCASKRDITIHIQNAKQFGLVSAVVSIDGKARRTLTGRHLTTAINLVGLPKGTFTVSIVAHTKSGQTLHGKRVYHTCRTRLPGHVHLRL